MKGRVKVLRRLAGADPEVIERLTVEGVVEGSGVHGVWSPVDCAGRDRVAIGASVAAAMVSRSMPWAWRRSQIVVRSWFWMASGSAEASMTTKRLGSC